MGIQTDKGKGIRRHTLAPENGLQKICEYYVRRIGQKYLSKRLSDRCGHTDLLSIEKGAVDCVVLFDYICLIASILR